MSVRMRHTRAHTANRRSHHALSETRFSSCAKCGVLHKRHVMCENCGTYRAREVIDVTISAKKKAEKLERKAKERAEESGKKSPIADKEGDKKVKEKV